MFIKSPPAEVRLWGMPGKLHLLPDSKRFFPEIACEQPKVQMNGEWKLEIELEMLFPGSTTAHAAPGLVFLLEREALPGATLIECVPLAEALAEFEVVWPWSLGWTEDMEREVTRLLDGRTYRLRMRGSPDEAVDALDALLMRLERHRPEPAQFALTASS